MLPLENIRKYQNGCCTVHSLLTQFASLTHRIFCKRNFSINSFFFCLQMHFGIERHTKRWNTIEQCWNVVAHILQFFMLSRRKIGFILSISLSLFLYPFPSGWFSQSLLRVMCPASFCLTVCLSEHRSCWRFHIF